MRSARYHGGTNYPAFHDLIRERRTVRAYRPDDIDLRLVEQAIEDAAWAPSPHHTQPWRFVLVSSETQRRRLAESMGEKWQEDLSADELSPRLIEGQLKGSRVRLSKARALLVVCLSERDLDKYPDERRQACERDMAVQSIGAAIQNLLLSLHLNGLGAAWMCAPLFAPEVVRDTLGLPDDWEPQALITIGRPVEPPPVPERRPLDESILLRA
ncbi:MAG TPA: nitroreductase family protein [Chloroflexota bacterium]|jgi:F420 biosynthesis protein FbiB-like protein|nr:nitroreductase family protein [Chloroflexota bacterium]